MARAACRKRGSTSYTGDKSRLTDKDSCIDKIYDPANPRKLSNFDWKGIRRCETIISSSAIRKGSAATALLVRSMKVRRKTAALLAR